MGVRLLCTKPALNIKWLRSSDRELTSLPLTSFTLRISDVATPKPEPSFLPGWFNVSQSQLELAIPMVNLPSKN